MIHLRFFYYFQKRSTTVMKENKTIPGIALFTGILLILASFLHLLNINDILVAVKTGDVAPSHEANIVIIWILAGVFMLLLGIWLLFLSGDLRRLRRKAWWQAFIIGLALGGSSVFCWIQYPRAEHVLFFLLIALLLILPLLLYTRKFSSQV